MQQEEKNTRKITVFMHLHAKKTSNFVEKFLKKDTVFLLYLYYLKFYKKKYFPGESHQIGNFICIHTTTLIIKIIASFSCKNYMFRV